jgi:hypothetical protein
MSAQTTRPPTELQGEKPERKILREGIWERLNENNEHFMGVVVGREGLGKSGTALKIAEMVDPGMSAEQAMFEPVDFIDKLRSWKRDGTTQGRMIVADEAGVGLGNRTWYEKDQIRFAQILQLIRSENMGMLFTLPRAAELDSQIRKGRLHAVLEILSKRDGQFTEITWQSVIPTRKFRDDVYTPKPRMKVDGVKHKIDTLKFGPPSDDLWEAYEKKKDAFQEKEYREAQEDMEDGSGDADSPVDSAIEEVVNNDRLEEVVSEHGSTGRKYVDADLLQYEFDLSQNEAKRAKSVIEKQVDPEEVTDS